jgi:hypothetical protein
MRRVDKGVISVTRYWYDSAEKFFCWTDCAVPEEQTEQELEEELCGFTEAAVERKMRAVVGSEEAFRAVRAERGSMAVPAHSPLQNRLRCSDYVASEPKMIN